MLCVDRILTNDGRTPTSLKEEEASMEVGDELGSEQCLDQEAQTHGESIPTYSVRP